MKKLLFLILIVSIGISACSKMKDKKESAQQVTQLTIQKDSLLDKIKGGWAGQTIGVTFGGPYEFRFNGTFIGDYQPLVWQDDFLKKYMLDWPGLYDDLYMDLTFVDVFEKYGLDAPVDSFANAFAHAEYKLWHANQAGRYNILNGIKAPQSGYWLNNPHADDIDYQIEADFAGLMSPGMPNAASAISDKIGHIMNYGDGWYGGIFVGAMYSIAFTSKDVNYIVTEALKTVPEQSEFYHCINDVVKWYKKYPNNWEQTWFEVQKKWGNDIGCPGGVFKPFDIDAKINSAYVVIGLLYGQGDYTKSLEISTRCGQDADCNPSTVGGILGTMYGYSHIPEYWKRCLKEAEDIDFKYTTMSLNDVYKISYKHALENIKKSGGEVKDEEVIIPLQKPAVVRFEKSFEGHFPISKTSLEMSGNNDEINFDFEGIGFVLSGEASMKNASESNYVFNSELYVDGKLVESPKLPVSFTTRRTELCWKYQMQRGKHTVRLKILNPIIDGGINSIEATVYDDRPVKSKY
jgi:hypothetical protein